MLFLAASSGTLLLASRTGTELSDIDSLLFGSAVAVMPAQFWWLVAVCLGVLVLPSGGGAVRGGDGDADRRASAGSRRALELALAASAALAVGVATWVLGALPTFAFSVLPALRHGPRANLPVALALGGVFGLVAGGGGYSRRSSPTPPWDRHRPPSRSRLPSSRRSPVVAEARYVDAQSLQAP